LVHILNCTCHFSTTYVLVVQVIIKDSNNSFNVARLRL
jgi:hypothetical protein